MTTLFSYDEIKTAAPIDAPPRKKRSWMPVLTILFCLSYGLMTKLVIEQGRTIDQQAALIHELFRDSTELATNKMKAQQQQRAAQARAQAKDQTPSTQAQNNAPSSQVAPHRAPAEKQAPRYEAPSRPASDQSEDRRALVRI